MTLMERRVEHVGMGELKVAKAPNSLEIRGLGSCIALALYDPLQRLAGLGHVVIPRPLANTPPAPGWAATDAVPALIEALERSGGRTNRLVARLAGGSSMFPGTYKGYEVGRENANVVERLLREHGIPVISRQIGGHASRSVRLDADSGRFDVETVRMATARRLAVADDPTEAARILLEAAARPLADLLQRPVMVEPTGRHELTRAGVAAFLGPHTPMYWSRLGYDGPAGRDELYVVIPDLHARRIDEELRSRVDEGAEPGSAIAEVLNIMLSHVLTALARLLDETLRPTGISTHRGRTPDMLQSTAFRDEEDVAVAHARVHLQDAFHGADLAILGRRLP